MKKTTWKMKWMMALMAAALPTARAHAFLSTVGTMFINDLEHNGKVEQQQVQKEAMGVVSGSTSQLIDAVTEIINGRSQGKSQQKMTGNEIRPAHPEKSKRCQNHVGIGDPIGRCPRPVLELRRILIRK